MILHRFLIVVALSTLSLAAVSVVADQHSYEAAEDLKAKDVLPADLLRGDHHKVENKVRSDGYLNYYTIQSDFGEFEAASTAMLRTRVGEIEALAELNELSKTEVFARAARDAGVKQLKTVQEFATRPVETITGIPKGVGRMFKRYSRQAKEGVAAASEAVSSDEDAEGAEGTDEHDSSTTDAAMGLTESYLGVGKAQRNWARKLGTDPYSTNEVLQDAIKEFAWAERLGTMGMGFAGVPKIPGADIIGDVNEAVWSKDPWELEDLNRERLVATGASEEVIEIYLDNRRMTPSQQTLLTAAIAELDGVEGRDGILRQSLQPDGETEMNFFIRSVTMLAWYHLNEAPLGAVKTHAAVPVGVSEDGDAVMLFAVDHLYWTESIATAARNHAARMTEGQKAKVLFLGTASERAGQELSGLGFDVQENVAAMMSSE